MNPELAWALRKLAKHIQEPLWGPNCPVLPAISLQQAQARAEEVHPAQVAQALTVYVQAMDMLTPSMQLKLLNAAAGGVEALQHAILKVPESHLTVLRPVLLFLQQWLLRQDPLMLHTLSYLWGAVLFPSLLQAGLNTKAASLCALLMSNALNIFRPTLTVKLPEPSSPSPSVSPVSSSGGSSTPTPASPRTSVPALLTLPTSPTHKLAQHGGKLHVEPLEQASSPTSPTSGAEAWLVPAGSHAEHAAASAPAPTTSYKPRHVRSPAWSPFPPIHTTSRQCDHNASQSVDASSPTPRSPSPRPPLYVAPLSPTCADASPCQPHHPYTHRAAGPQAHGCTAMERAAAALQRGSGDASGAALVPPSHSLPPTTTQQDATTTTTTAAGTTGDASDEPWAADPAWGHILTSLVSHTVTGCLFGDDDDDDDVAQQADVEMVDVSVNTAAAVASTTTTTTTATTTRHFSAPATIPIALPLLPPSIPMLDGVSVCVVTIGRKQLTLHRSCSAPCTKSLAGSTAAGCGTAMECNEGSDVELDVAKPLDQTSPRPRHPPLVAHRPIQPSPLSLATSPSVPTSPTPLPGGCLKPDAAAQWHMSSTCFPVTCGM